jgi:ATP-dependent Clp protease adaptor protein ClpS
VTEESPAPAVPVVEPEVRVRHAPRYKVFIHNDPVTTMEFVIYVLTGIFSLRHREARDVMLEAHTSGIAFVGAFSFEQAEFRVDQAHALARSHKFPLTFTYEPE